MTPAPIPGYLTKKEVTERFGRSHRSLTRDFSTAIRMEDEEVLTHLKLQTEDGTERAGTEVTLEQIQQLSNDGLSPTWYVEGEWAAQRYGTRETSTSPEPTTAKAGPANAKPPASSFESNELVSRLETQITDLQRDKEQLYQELTIKNEQIKQANERTRESNILMKELQSLLANAQQRALLPVPPHSGERSSPSPVDVFESEEVPVPVTAEATPVASTKSTLVVKQKQKGSGRKKSTPVKASRKSTATDTKFKWHEMPTFRKLLSRRQD